MSGGVWDPGLQPERTRLAWQRTSLALLAAGLIIARVVGHYALTPGVVIATIATLLAGTIGMLSTRRYARAQVRLNADRPLPGGAVNLLLTLAFLVVGVGAALYIVIV